MISLTSIIFIFSFCFLIIYTSVSITSYLFFERMTLDKQVCFKLEFPQEVRCNTIDEVLNSSVKYCSSFCLRISIVCRFGNSFIQFLNVLRVAIHSEIKRIVVPQGFLTLSSSFYFGDIFFEMKNNYRNCVSGDFFYPTALMRKLPAINFSSTSFIQFRDFFLSHFKQIIPNNTLVLHIRSGDIFSGKNVHHGYGQPPCQYYKDIMKFAKWSKIILIAEDYGNPCVRIIQKEGAKFQINSLHQDLSVLLNAPNIGFSKGTFGMPILRFSKTIQTAFFFDQSDNFIRNICSQFPTSICFNCIPTLQYKRDILDFWYNNQSQLRIMISSQSCKEWTVFSKDETLTQFQDFLYRDIINRFPMRRLHY